jgi:hypothetical protein
MLASVLSNYDVEIGNDGGRAFERWFEVASSPDPTAKVMFRERTRMQLVSCDWAG